MSQEAKARILIVDDEPANLDVLAGLLTPEFEVQAAKSGEQGLARAAGQTRPQLILLDVMMPGMDGYEVCRQLKAKEATRDIPVIFVTALNEVADETAGLELGAVDYITKPISPPIVLARIRGVLSRLRLQGELDRIQQSLTTMIVRDLRGPLQIVNGYTRMALRAPWLSQDPGTRAALERVLESAEIASSLVLQMLDITQLRSGKVVLQRSETDFSKLLSQIAFEQKLAAGARSIRFEQGIAPGLTSQIDPEKIGEVVNNLLTNAFKATGPGGRVELAAERATDGSLLCAITYSGQGLPPDAALTLFAPWEETRDDKGLKVHGLGLAISKMIVEAHGGSIRASTPPGGGARFEFSLPPAAPSS